jgi:hypothetical protein
VLDRGLDLAESARHTMASARPQQNGGAGRPMPVSLTAGPDPGLRPGPAGSRAPMPRPMLSTAADVAGTAGLVGPSIQSYKTHREVVAQNSKGGLEFHDCQNPDASDGYIVGPKEPVPGYAPEYIKGNPHRELTAYECQRYSVPIGSILMATKNESQEGEIPLIEEPLDDMSEEAQIRRWCRENGKIPWTRSSALKPAVFTESGLPVPRQFMVRGSRPVAASFIGAGPFSAGPMIARTAEPVRSPAPVYALTSTSEGHG